MDNDYSNVFLSDRFKKLGLFKGNQTPEDVQLQQALIVQQRIQDSCLMKASVIGAGSGLLGM